MPVIPISVVRKMSDEEFCYCLVYRRDSHSTLYQDLWRRIALGKKVAMVNGEYAERWSSPLRVHREWPDLDYAFKAGSQLCQAKLLLSTAATFNDPLKAMRMSPRDLRGLLQGVADRGLTWEQLTPKQQKALKMAKDVYGRERDKALGR